MFVGHYSVSFAGKKASQAVPLSVLFLAVQLLDIGWSILVLLGIEKLRIVPGITETNPLDLYYMPYTHSLVAALAWSVAAFLFYRFFNRDASTRAAVIVAGAVFSHWILDFIVHRPDLPLYDDTAKVGLGLWNHAALAFTLEIVLLFGSLTWYLRGTGRRPVGFVLLGVVMVAVQAYVFFGPPPSSPQAMAVTALAAYIVFAWVADRVERRSSARAA